MEAHNNKIRGMLRRAPSSTRRKGPQIIFPSGGHRLLWIHLNGVQVWPGAAKPGGIDCIVLLVGGRPIRFSQCGIHFLGGCFQVLS